MSLHLRKDRPSITDPGSQTLQSIGVVKRPDEKLRQSFPGARAARGRGDKYQWAHLLAPRGSWSLKWGEGGVGPGIGPQVWLGWPAHPLVVCLLLLLAPKKWQLGVWCLCILLFIICPNCAGSYLQLLFVPLVSLYSVAQRKRLSRCQHCSQRSQARLSHS